MGTDFVCDGLAHPYTAPFAGAISFCDRACRYDDEYDIQRCE